MWLLPAFAHGAATTRVALDASRKKHAFLIALALSMLIFEAIGNLAHDRMTSSAYFRFWIASYLVTFSLVALALTEACSRSVESYERFGEAARRIIRFILVSSGIAMVGLLFFLPDSLAKHYVPYFQAQAYLGQGSLALLGLGLLAFAHWARLRLHRNAKLTIIVISCLCALECLLGSTISAAWPSMRVYVGISGALLLWGTLILLWSNEPDVRRNTGSGAGPEHVAPALARMAAMNRQLDELVRRG